MRLHLSEHDPQIDEVTGAPLLDFENYCCGNVFARSFALFLGQLKGDTCFPLEEPLPTKRILLSEDPTPLTCSLLLFFIITLTIIIGGSSSALSTTPLSLTVLAYHLRYCLLPAARICPFVGRRRGPWLFRSHCTSFRSVSSAAWITNTTCALTLTPASLLY